MRLVRVRWGKFRLELPGEVLFLLVKLAAFLIVHKLNG